jgi:hypothetical protein
MERGTLRKAGTAIACTWRDLPVLVPLALAVEIGVRTRPLPSVARLLGCRLRGTTDPTGRTSLTRSERRRTAAVHILFRHWPFTDPDGACLRRSLLLGWVLRRRDPVLRIGVARTTEPDELTAHAWLEVQGVSIGADATHAPFAFDRGITE